MRYAVLFVWLLAGGLAQAQECCLHGFVRDAQTGEPLPGASLQLVGSTLGVAADADGHVHLCLCQRPGVPAVVRVSAVGYHTLERPAVAGTPQQYDLQPDVAALREVVVQGAGVVGGDLTSAARPLHATEDLLQRVPGVTLVARGNMAWEATVRGTSGGQVALTIDGMKVHGACVDKMDPPTSYVEVENLARLEVAAGGFDLSHGAQVGGAVNLVTDAPRFGAGAGFTVESGVESAAALRRMRAAGRFAVGDWAGRASASYRAADDFRPGGGADALPGSGYHKRNVQAALARRFGTHTLTASVLADDAWEVGYPVLLMDATLASARLLSLHHTWTPTGGPLAETRLRLYHSGVDHWMDDRTRDVLERPVMRGMYMPMYGYTDTYGVRGEATARLGRHTLRAIADGYTLRSFGDMWMYSLYAGIPDMYLLNLGDIRTQHGALTLESETPLTSRLQLQASLRGDLLERAAHRPEIRSLLQSKWGLTETGRRDVLPSVSAALSYQVRPATRLRVALAATARPPTPVESHGHYVYNYVDGYFYTGNPALKAERSRQAEVGVTHAAARFAMDLRLFYNALRDPIVGRNDAGFGGAPTGTYRFRAYGNSRSATLAGGEVRGSWRFAAPFEVAAAASYTYGHNHTLGEPLPMIAPLGGFAALRYQPSWGWLEAEARWAAAQSRIAQQAASEDATGAWSVLNLRGGVRLGAGVTLSTGVENAFDTAYSEHLSIGNLPARGRNVYAMLTVSR